LRSRAVTPAEARWLPPDEEKVVIDDQEDQTAAFGFADSANLTMVTKRVLPQLDVEITSPTPPGVA
jgi:hypothetical protein